MQSTVLGTDGEPVVEPREHDLWVVVSQDCDLNSTDTQYNTAVVELRPLLTTDVPPTWGIKSRKLKLDDGLYLDAELPHLHVSPAALTHVATAGAVRTTLSDERTIALKTWLGYRYRRPAVPDHLVPLGREIAKAVEKARPGAMHEAIHEIVFQVDDSGRPFKYSLFAIVQEGSDEEAVREWLSAVALDVDPALGIADELEARTKRSTSIELLETSWSANVSDLTWRRDPSPRGSTE
jgi:hypothetical protein